VYRSFFVRYVLIAAGLIVLVALLALAGACNSAPQATPTPTRTPRPVNQASTPAAPPTTQAPTNTPAPTNAPTASATPRPTATPAPTAVPSNTSTTAAQTIVPARDPNISPFTGLRPADPAVLQRRPLALKVPNEQAVIPQSGLSKADVVIESRVEFCMTRFTVIFQSQDAPRAGNIRSARLIDAELPVIFDAVLCFSGAVEPVRQKLYKSDIGDFILEQALNDAAYFRDPSIPVPHNLFADTKMLWDAVTQRGWNKAPQPSAAWVFSEAAPAAGSPVSRADVPYPEFKVYWTYNAGSGRWQRFMGGQPHVDRADGQQLTAANVVILGANHVQTLIPEHGEELTEGACSNRSVEIQLWGEGPLKILRNGKVYEGKWVRSERHAPFRFVNAAGQDIPLKPGNSWWQVVPLDMKVTTMP
jgi:hypothetical protein